VFGSGPKDLEVVGGLAVDNDFFDLAFENHPGNTLESVFESAFAFLNRCHVEL
jgi:hypothetical protein